jgi:hypothetical protein
MVFSHEHQSIYEGHPPQGLSEARRVMGASILKFLLFLIRRGGAPSGAAAFILHLVLRAAIF